MKRIMIINTIGMGYEGMSSVIMNYLKNVDRTGFQIDVAVFPDTNQNYRKSILNISNLRVVDLPDRKKELRAYISSLSLTLKHGNYDVLHIHGNSATMIIEVLLGKTHRIKKIITHVHNTKCDHPLINHILRVPMCLLADCRVACSDRSGEYLYKKNYLVLRNAIDLERFSFNEQIRDEMRQKLGINHKIVIGHIGSFIEQKNHQYLIGVFEILHEIVSDSVLLLLSDGPEKKRIESIVKEKGIADSVLFLGRIGDVERYYQCMDVFVLPSKWEGLPLVMLEAQASGLPVFASNAITKEACCTNDVYYLSIDESPEKWAESILSYISKDRIRKPGINIDMDRKGFNIKKEAKALVNIYNS